MPATVRGAPLRVTPAPSPLGSAPPSHELARVVVDQLLGLTSIYRALVRKRVDPASAPPTRQGQLPALGADPAHGAVAAGRHGRDLAGRRLPTQSGDRDRRPLAFCVAAGLIERADAHSVCRIFTQALARYGIPEEVLTDNAKAVTGRLGPHPAEILFDRICPEHDITHVRTGVRCPTTTGKIERFHKTLRAGVTPGGPSIAPGSLGHRVGRGEDACHGGEREQPAGVHW
jgi:transposase InsO family protein